MRFLCTAYIPESLHSLLTLHHHTYTLLCPYSTFARQLDRGADKILSGLLVRRVLQCQHRCRQF